MHLKNIIVLISVFQLHYMFSTRFADATISVTGHDSSNRDQEFREYIPSSFDETMPKFKYIKRMKSISYKPSSGYFRFKCQAEGNPTPNITWLKNDEIPKRHLGNVHYSKWSISMEDLETSDSGNYTCIVCNDKGCINFTTELIVIEPINLRPNFTSPPKYITKIVGENVYFTCEVKSDLYVFIQWAKITRNVAVDELSFDMKNEYLLTLISNDISTLELKHVTEEDEGWYICLASNSLGKSIAKAYLKVVECMCAKDLTY